MMEKSDLEFRVRTKFSSLVLVGVVRSFSIYSDIILASNRLNFTFQNVEMLCISSYNGPLFGEYNLDKSTIEYEDDIMNFVKNKIILCIGTFVII